MKRELSVKNQSVETSGITKDYKEAFCEYIWNGFEANATRVDLNFVYNELGGVSEVIICDNGGGISFESLEDTFDAFLASQKSGLSLQLKSRTNKGKGRFSCFAFATDAQWETISKRKSDSATYVISLNSVNKNEYDVSDPVSIIAPTGTTVTITGIDALRQEDVSFDALEDTLLKSFAWYLYLNKHRDISLIVAGTEMDYSKYIDTESSLTESVTIDATPFELTLIVWKEKIKENFCSYYLDSDNVVKGKDTTTFNRNTVNFNHSVFVRSAFFDNRNEFSLTSVLVDDDDQITVEEIEREKAVLRKIKKAIQTLIGKSMNEYMAGQADKAVQSMVERKTFPQFSNDIYGELRKQDLVQVTKELYCLEPRIFHRLKDVQEKSLLGFLNLLLSSEERENVLTIIEGIVDLTPEQRSEFASVLKRTKLENIIVAIKFIEDRYKVIEALKRIIFDLAEYANERDHVQKIIEQHYWLFGEQYHLVTADQRMQKTLEQYLYLLYGDNASVATLTKDEAELRRMDIFACGLRKTEDSTGDEIQENLIVELKAPQIVLSKKVLRQIEDYMDFIRKQPQFNSQYRRWRFVAVCKAVDDDVKSRYVAHNAKGKKGLVSDIDNYEIYALTWDDVFKSFELRHGFLLDKLKMDQSAIADELSSKADVLPSRKSADDITQAVTAM